MQTTQTTSFKPKKKLGNPAIKPRHERKTLDKMDMSKFRENILKSRRKKFTTTPIPIRYSSSTKPPFLTSSRSPTTTTRPTITTTAFPAATTMTVSPPPTTPFVSPVMVSTTSMPVVREPFEYNPHPTGCDAVHTGLLLLFLFLMCVCVISYCVLIRKQQPPSRRKKTYVRR